ncbi:ribosomal RNA small subunit methyltransferase A [bacterium]|nr:ribosomal RNA small subunit methyltransferase A [bacterium]
MELISKKSIKNLLKQYQIRPSKKLGQNFLIDKGVIKKFIKACDFKEKDTILEIGPGIGTLTKEIAKKVKKVIAVEKDPKMIEILKEALKDFKNVKIIQGDILKIFNFLPHQKFGGGFDYKVIGNLPFYLSAPVIRKFLEAKNPPKEMIFIIQKEVAQRICAKPPKMSILAVSVQVYAKPKIISYVSKKSFWSKPKVDGAIIKISNLKSQISSLDKDLFFKIVRAGFSHPRKQLVNNLSKELKITKERVKNWLLENGLQPSLRAEDLSVENWIKLAKSYTIKV